MDSVIVGFIIIYCTVFVSVTTSEETAKPNSTISQCPDMCTCSLREFMVVDCEIHNDDFNVGDALDVVLASFSSLSSSSAPVNISLNCNNSQIVLWYSATPLHSVVSLRVTNCHVDTRGSAVVFPKTFTIKSLHFKEVNPSFFHQIDLRELRGVQTIVVEKCNLSSVPEVLIPKDTSRLATLSFRYNNLSEIDCKLFSGFKGERGIINFDNNVITHVPRCICENTTMFYRWRLGYNRIKDIGGLACIKQQHIDFTDNRVEDIPVFKYDSAITFDATFNKIKVIRKESFMHLVNCQSVTLSYNNIEWIEDGAFKTLRSLRLLYLDANRIKRFEVPHAPTTTLFECYIYLHNNQLEYPPFRKDNYKPPLRLQTVAKNNPFICDCEARRFQGYFTNSSRRIIVRPNIVLRTLYSSLRDIYVDANLYRCSLPLYASGQYLLKMNMTNQCPEVKNCPAQCVCTRDVSTDEVFVNCSSSKLTEMPSKLPDSKLVIDLSYNFIKVLDKRDFMFRTLSLNISNNLLEVVKPDAVPLFKKLASLDLRHNRISNLPTVFKEFPFVKTASVFLSFNDYVCSCEILWMSKWLAERRNEIVEEDRLFCLDIRRNATHLIRDLNENDLGCRPIFNSHERLAIGLGITAVLVLVVVLLLFRFRSELQVLFYVKIQLRFFLKEVERKQFDAFISYSEYDREFVTNLVRKLENERPLPYTVCIHDRDFAIGLPIAENISSAINRSRVVIFWVSDHFADSNWCTFEFQTSYQTMVMEKNLKLIVIKHGHVDVAKLDDDMKAYFRTNSILDTTEPLFWEKLLYALPHPGADEFEYKTND